MRVSQFKKELENFKDSNTAIISQKFFKTGKGEYGEGDIFLGIKVPVQREICKKYNLNLNEIEQLLKSNIHEHRLCALFILINKFEKSDIKEKKEIFDFYLRNRDKINNWDLVDSSAYKIVGEWLVDKSRNVLYDLVKSNNIWSRRIAIISTYAFIKRNDFVDCLKISELLLKDNEDLIHKAVGWMLREVGNRDKKVEQYFLDKHHSVMPRTALRYSIEKFSEDERDLYLHK